MAIYLSYFDRELGRSVDFKLAPGLLKSITNAILLCSFEPLYCGLSLVWEQPAAHSVRDYVGELIHYQQLELTSAYASGSDFLAAKRLEYAHDKRRYPRYFQSDADRQLANIPTLQHVSSRTTPALVHALNDWSQRWEASYSNIPATNRRRVTTVVRRTLAQRGSEAVTLSLFRSGLEKAGADPRSYFLVGSAISRSFTQHHQELMKGRSPTGIPGLSFYDSLGNSFPYLDYVVLTALFDLLEFPRMREKDLVEVLSARGSIEHLLFVDQLRRLLLVSYDPRGEIAGRRAQLIESFSIARRYLRKKQTTQSWRQEFVEGANRLADLLKRDHYQRRIDRAQFQFPVEPTLEHFCSLSEASRFSGTAEVLIVVATEVEEEAALSRLRSYSTEFLASYTYYRGEFAGHKTVVTRCEPGSVGRDAAVLTIDAAIRAIQPRVVLMVGIAFGLNRKKQNITDVLVSRSVYPYEPQRIGKDKKIPRGDEILAGATIYNRFRELSRGWHDDDAKVHFGTVLSGEKLVDNRQFLAELKEIAPEAIGGEMEGAGLCAVAAKNKIEWILVKAICDWGDGAKKKRYQRPAAEHAISLVESVLSEPGVLDALAPTLASRNDFSFS
jgi:nucleoside phosphorylase